MKQKILTRRLRQWRQAPRLSFDVRQKEMHTLKISHIIDDSLWLVLFGIQSTLEIDLKGKEVKRIFSDSEADQVSAKTYQLFEMKEIIVKEIVEEYEPETIELIVTTKKLDQKQINKICEDALVFRHLQKQGANQAS